MAYAKRYYKTEKGFFSHKNVKYMSIDEFFASGDLAYDKKHEKFYYKLPSKELRALIADRFVERVFSTRSKADRAWIKKSLVDGDGDVSYFQCFYTDGSNSLSGDAYDYCRRKYIKSIR